MIKANRSPIVIAAFAFGVIVAGGVAVLAQTGFADPVPVCVREAGGKITAVSGPDDCNSNEVYVALAPQAAIDELQAQIDTLDDTIADLVTSAQTANVLCPACDLAGAQLAGVVLPGAYLRDANFSEANLSGADLSGADMRGINASDANFENADLSGANLGEDQTNFARANLRFANLSGIDGQDDSGADGVIFSLADLTGADLTSADITGAGFNFADLTDADLTDATGLDSAAIFETIWSNTVCPDGSNSDDEDGDGFTCESNA